MKGICYLICAGDASALDFTPDARDLVIAVDGGCRYLRSAGIEPRLAVGDFDSLGAAPSVREIIRLDSVKDVTDTFAAAEEGLRRGYKEFRLYCALGGRLSHTLANIQTLAYLTRHGARGRIVGDGIKIDVVDKSASFAAGGYLSLLPLTDTATVKISGCKYSGTFTLTRADSLGVSNEPLSGAKVEVLCGEVVAITEKK